VSVWRRDGGDLLLALRLSPGARREGLGGLWADADGAHWLSASVRAVAEKGRANGALIALVADLLDIPKSTISLESGDTNRLKRVRIKGGGAAETQARMTAIIEERVQAS
jgi:uncharacterized protein YggU (UPF0235/DUF167 family)